RSLTSFPACRDADIATVTAALRRGRNFCRIDECQIACLDGNASTVPIIRSVGKDTRSEASYEKRASRHAHIPAFAFAKRARGNFSATKDCQIGRLHDNTSSVPTTARNCVCENARVKEPSSVNLKRAGNNADTSGITCASSARRNLSVINDFQIARLHVNSVSRVPAASFFSENACGERTQTSSVNKKRVGKDDDISAITRAKGSRGNHSARNDC